MTSPEMTLNPLCLMCLLHVNKVLNIYFGDILVLLLNKTLPRDKPSAFDIFDSW